MAKKIADEKTKMKLRFETRVCEPSPGFWLDLNFKAQYRRSLTIGSDRGALPIQH